MTEAVSSRAPVLSRSAHDRAADLRERPDRLAALWPDALVLPMAADGSVPVRVAQRVRLDWRASDGFDRSSALFLGVADGRGYFANIVDAGEGWMSLRDMGARLDELDAGLVTSAVALVAWHQRTGHCPRCGAPTSVERAGWMRQCPVDGSEHFPRTDPAVIMLVEDGNGRCLLGRQRVWPQGRFSVLAGFVEAGEAPEAAVVREVAEEAGVAVGDVRYLASQPWPFPQSLMLGYTARLLGSDALTLVDGELVEAGWFTREQVAAAAEWGGTSDLTAETAADTGTALEALPGPVSIARQLIDRWLADG